MGHAGSLSTLSDEENYEAPRILNEWRYDTGSSASPLDASVPAWQQPLKFDDVKNGFHSSDAHNAYYKQPVDRKTAEKWIHNLWTQSQHQHIHYPVIVCIDTQTFPVRAEKHTEIGLSFLDTRDVLHMPPGQHCENWLHRVRTRHLRIWENGTWITYGMDDTKKEKLWNGNKFLFGRSEWVAKDDVRGIVSRELLPRTPSDEDRPFILVGHNWHKKEKFFSSLCKDILETTPGSSPIFTFSTFSNVQGVIDTSNLFADHDGQPKDLTTLLREQGYNNLVRHNAGNDAFYTMLLLLRFVASDPTINPSITSEQVTPTAQDVLTKVRLNVAEKTPRVDDGRCSACGRHGHTEKECVWLIACMYCNKNGFCDHRPKPVDETPQQPPRRESINAEAFMDRRGSNPHYPFTHISQGSSGISTLFPTTSGISMPSIVATSMPPQMAQQHLAVQTSQAYGNGFSMSQSSTTGPTQGLFNTSNPFAAATAGSITTRHSFENIPPHLTGPVYATNNPFAHDSSSKTTTVGSLPFPTGPRIPQQPSILPSSYPPKSIPALSKSASSSLLPTTTSIQLSPSTTLTPTRRPSLIPTTRLDPFSTPPHSRQNSSLTPATLASGSPASVFNGGIPGLGAGLTSSPLAVRRNAICGPGDVSGVAGMRRGAECVACGNRGCPAGWCVLRGLPHTSA